MSLKSEIEKYTTDTFRTLWTTRKGTVVPDSESIALKNEGVIINGTVLYTDMDGSTSMVENYKKEFCGEVYKTFLYAAAKIIRSENGSITSYDGDRIMAVFIGNAKNTQAVRAALKINYARTEIINKKLKEQYSTTNFSLKHVTGIDTCELMAARTGIRGSNDLVWIGNAANHAAKLTTLSSGTPTWITHAIYTNMHDEVKISNGINMWQSKTWNAMPGKTLYCSTYWWRID